MGQNKSKIVRKDSSENMRRINRFYKYFNFSTDKYNSFFSFELNGVLEKFDFVSKLENAFKQGYIGIQVYINHPLLLLNRPFTFQNIESFISTKLNLTLNTTFLPNSIRLGYFSHDPAIQFI